MGRECCKSNETRLCIIALEKELNVINLLKYLFPNLIKELECKKDKLDPTKTFRGSGKKAWWLCKNGHEWEAVIQSRTGYTGCTYCTGYKAPSENIILKFSCFKKLL